MSPFKLDMGLPVLAARGGGGLPGPGQIFGASLQGWWRSSSLLALGNGTPIQDWADSSGNSRTLRQNVVASQPIVLVEDGVGYAISDGVDDFLLALNWAAIPQPFTVFGVFLLLGVTDNAVMAPALGLGDQVVAPPAVSIGKGIVNTPDVWRQYAGVEYNIGSSDNVRRSWISVFNGASSSTLLGPAAPPAALANAGTGSATYFRAFNTPFVSPHASAYGAWRATEIGIVSAAASVPQQQALSDYLQQFV